MEYVARALETDGPLYIVARYSPALGYYTPVTTTPSETEALNLAASDGYSVIEVTARVRQASHGGH